MNRKLKSLLIENGVKQADIARKIGVNRSTVSSVLGGHQNSQHVKSATAELLGLRIEQLEKLWKRRAA
ncbi:MAG: helix-turn-helix transcriptional regulator [Desulfuromonadaceae bacterium]|nr:helix-turn-helix transcriptional regulator [Desulfuromonadaceae bacterium]